MTQEVYSPEAHWSPPSSGEISHVRLDIRDGSALVSVITGSGFPLQQSLGTPDGQQDRAVRRATIDLKVPFLRVNHDLIDEFKRRKDASTTVTPSGES